MLPEKWYFKKFSFWHFNSHCLEDNRNNCIYVFITEIIWLTWQKVSFEILPPLYHQLMETSTFFIRCRARFFLCMFVFASSNRSKTGFQASCLSGHSHCAMLQCSWTFKSFEIITLTLWHKSNILSKICWFFFHNSRLQ